MVILDDAPLAAPAYAPEYAPCEFRVKWADSAWEISQARALRRAVFCEEQGVFDGDDVDTVDGHAQVLVAVSALGGMPDQVVGTVRIHAASALPGAADQTIEAPDGVWWGSRLAVLPALRAQGHLGATLIRLAVCSAHARGCRVFLAHVQAQNVPLFEKLHWLPLRPELLHGRPHVLMQASLAAYPPCHDPLSGFVTRGRPGLSP